MTSQVLIAPSILAADFARLGDEIATVEQAGADRLHIDVMDGHFVPNISFGFPILAAARRCTALHLEVHLMITDPDRYLDAFVAAGADSLIVHWEGNAHLHRTVQRVRALGRPVGVALNPATPAAMLEDLAPDLDLILVMTVNPGFGQQAFLEPMVAKIERVRRMVERAAPACQIEVDGGIDAATAPRTVAAGASIVVAGSAIFGAVDGVPAAMRRLRAAVQHAPV